MNALLRLPEVMRLTGLRKSAIYKRVEDGLLSSQIKIGSYSVAWPENEIIAINHALIAGKNNDEIRALVASLESARSTVGGVN